MKSKKNKQENTGGGDELNKRLSSDFVVHSMPVPISFNSESEAGSSGGSGNHKKTGLIIVSFGILLIGGLIYGAYLLAIKPSLTQKPIIDKSSLEEVAAVQDEILKPIIEPEIIATDPVVEDVATSTIDFPETGTSSEIIYPIDVIDTDGDGLSDAEEKLVGSDENKVDSDNDGNNDLVELRNSYNPAGDGRLIASPYFSTFNNQQLNYSVLYPKDWILKSLNENVIINSADSNYFIQIIHQTNDEHLDINDWFRNELPEQIMGEKLDAKDGSWSGVYRSDGAYFYLGDRKNNNIYIFSLETVEGNIAIYKNIFEVVINNFKLNLK